MSKWEMVRLGDISRIVSGSTPKTSVQEYWDGDINWVTPAELTDDTVIVNETQRKLTRIGVKETGLKPFPAGTVLLSSRAPIGKVAIAGTEMYCNQGFKNIICNANLHNKYLFWYLKGKTVYLNDLGRGATFKEISKTIVEDVKIPLAPLNMQKQIAVVLDSAMELINLRKQRLVELDNLIKSMFYDMFGDPITNSKGWEVQNLGDCCDNLKYGTSTPPIFSDTGFKFIRATNIKNGRIINEDMKYISKKEAEKIQKCELFGDEIIIVRSGVNTGDTCVVTSDYINDFAGYDIIISLNKNILNPVFLNELINTNFMNVKIKPLTRRAAQPHINIQQVKSLLIIVPPIVKQQNFSGLVEKIEEQKSEVKKSLEENQLLFDSLMNRYFG